MNKRQLLTKLLFAPKRKNPKFWQKQFAMLKFLLNEFPDIKFWETHEFEKVNCLTLYLAEKKEEISEKYKRFKFQPEFKNPDFNIGNKTGEDYNTTVKPKTIKQFLK